MGRILTRQQRIELGAQRVAQPNAVPIAISGWNTRDVLTGMSETDAVLLDNFYPDANGLTMRQGFVPYASGIGSGTVPTLVEYNAGASRKFLAAGGGKIFDISSSGPVGSPLASGFARDWWNTIHFNAHTFFFNGQDTPQDYNGSTIANTTLTGPSNPANWVGGTAYQNRLYLIEKNRQGFWFGPLLGVSGPCTFFDLSMLTDLGGNVVNVGTYSYDGGAGVFDYICFLMNTGEIFVYSGTDPSLAANWQLVGKFRISPSVNIRAAVRYGGELYITTSNDHIGVQQGLVALRTGLTPPRTKVSNAVAAAVAANPNADGWQALYYTNGRRILFNIPNTDGTFDQHIYNTTNDGWCRFRGHPSATWGLFKDKLYFGASSGGIVYQADTGNLDFGTQAIVAVGQQAWNLFGSAERKLVHAVRPIIQSLGTVGFGFGVGFDYAPINTPVVTSAPLIGSPWDVSPWDVSPWSAEFAVDPTWHSAQGDGHAMSWTLAIAARQPVAWLRTDLWTEEGQGL